MKKILVIVLLTIMHAVSAKQLILIDFNLNNSVEILVDKDSIKKVDNSVYVEMYFNTTEPPSRMYSQRLLNCKNRESSLLKLSFNDAPLESPKNISAAYVPDDGKPYSKAFNYVCNITR